MERGEANGRPVGADIVLDSEEPSLSYGWLYFGLMRAVPELVAGLLAASVMVAVRSRRG